MPSFLLLPRAQEWLSRPPALDTSTNTTTPNQPQSCKEQNGTESCACLLENNSARAVFKKSNLLIHKNYIFRGKIAPRAILTVGRLSEGEDFTMACLDNLPACPSWVPSSPAGPGPTHSPQYLPCYLWGLGASLSSYTSASGVNKTIEM